MIDSLFLTKYLNAQYRIIFWFDPPAYKMQVLHYHIDLQSKSQLKDQTKIDVFSKNQHLFDIHIKYDYYFCTFSWTQTCL